MSNGWATGDAADLRARACGLRGINSPTGHPLIPSPTSPLTAQAEGGRQSSGEHGRGGLGDGGEDSLHRPSNRQPHGLG
jgi:hypothetical protein